MLTSISNETLRSEDVGILRILEHVCNRGLGAFLFCTS